MTTRKKLFRVVLVVIAVTAACCMASAGTAQEPDLDYLTYLPFMARYPVGPTPTATPPALPPTSTPTPTPTETPTNTPTPTSTPGSVVLPTETPLPTTTPTLPPTWTPTPISTPEGAWVNAVMCYDPGSTVHVMGEVCNGFPDRRIGGIEVLFALYDGEQPVFAGHTNVWTSVWPGDSICFDSAQPYVPIGWQHLRLELDLNYSTGSPGGHVLDLELTGISMVYRGAGRYEVSGQVTNREPVRINNVWLVIGLKNALGQVVGCKQYGHAYTSDLLPGQTSPFTQLLWTCVGYDAVSAEVWAFGSLAP